MRLQKIREFLHRSGVLALGYVDDLAADHINEQADMIVAAPRRSFIRRDLPQLGQVLFLDRLPYIVVENAPQPRIVLAHPLGDVGYRHRLGQRQHIGFKQQRETRTRASPGNRDLVNSTRRASHPWGARMQERAMLKEVQMPPRLGFRVVDPAAFASAFRAHKPAPGWKIHVQIEPAVRDRKLAAHHLPRRRQTQGQLEKIGVSHPFPIPQATRQRTWG